VRPAEGQLKIVAKEAMTLLAGASLAARERLSV
jgi:hypothetical protein